MLSVVTLNDTASVCTVSHFPPSLIFEGKARCFPLLWSLAKGLHLGKLILGKVRIVQIFEFVKSIGALRQSA
jgi:hypothetical protein